jgi:hypothetical protein
MTRTFELIEKIVDSLDLSIQVNSIDSVNNVLFVCKTLHIRKDSIVKDSLDKEFRVVDFENNKSIKIQALGSYTFFGFVVFAPKPFFLQGKWISANNEYLLMSNDTRKKTPLIWLVRGYKERHNGLMSSVKLEVEPIIFFLDEADFDNWTNEQHDKEAINPMYNLAELFVKKVEKMSKIKTLEYFDIVDEPRFGVKYSNEKGNSKRILSDDLSGVSLKIPIKYYGCENC